MPYGHQRRPQRPARRACMIDTQTSSERPRTSQDASGITLYDVHDAHKRRIDPMNVLVWLLVVPLCVAISIWTGYIIYLVVFT